MYVFLIILLIGLVMYLMSNKRDYNEDLNKQDFNKINRILIECENKFFDLIKTNNIDINKNDQLFIISIYSFFPTIYKYNLSEDDLNLILNIPIGASLNGQLKGLSKEEINNSIPSFLKIFMASYTKKEHMINSYNLFKYSISKGVLESDSLIICTYSMLVEIDNFDLKKDIISILIKEFSKKEPNIELINKITNNYLNENESEIIEKNKDSFFDSFNKLNKKEDK